MYVALGQPPADVLARPVPTEGVTPTNMKPTPPPPSLSNGPQAANTPGGPEPMPSTPATQPVAAAPRPAVLAAGTKPAIPPPANITEILRSAGR